MNQHSNVPLKKQAVNNDHGLFEWQSGDPASNVVLENKKMGIKFCRYFITRPNGEVLYDTIGIVEPQGGSIVVIKNTNDELGLIHEWRPIPEKWFWACVRGFGDPDDLGALATAKREIIEEIGNCEIVRELDLGEIYQNTTFYEKPAKVILLIVKDLDEKVSGDEGIEKIKFFSKREIIDMIKDGEIEDTFTLSALAKVFAAEWQGNSAT